MLLGAGVALVHSPHLTEYSLSHMGDVPVTPGVPESGICR